MIFSWIPTWVFIFLSFARNQCIHSSHSNIRLQLQPWLLLYPTWHSSLSVLLLCLLPTLCLCGQCDIWTFTISFVWRIKIFSYSYLWILMLHSAPKNHVTLFSLESHLLSIPYIHTKYIFLRILWQRLSSCSHTYVALADLNLGIFFPLTKSHSPIPTYFMSLNMWLFPSELQASVIFPLFVDLLHTTLTLFLTCIVTAALTQLYNKFGSF